MGPDSSAVGGWRALATTDGSFTLEHPLHGQACHSRAGAWEESHLTYARGCRLAERAAREPRLALLGARRCRRRAPACARATSGGDGPNAMYFTRFSATFTPQ